MRYPLPPLQNIAFVLLCLLTIVTGLPLLAASANLFYFRVIDTSKGTFPGDPDIGAGLLYMAVIANVPTLLCWIVYWAMEVSKRKTTPN